MKTSAIAAAVMLTALGLWARASEVLPGELWLAQRLSGRRGVVFTVAQALDEGLNDWGAPVVFSVLLAGVLARWGAWAALQLTIAGVSTVALKVVDLVERPRPTSDLRWGRYIDGYGGFPSGHVVYVTVLAVTLAMLAHTSEESKLVRIVATVTAVLLTTAVGPARLITNDHWAADVVAGYLLAVILIWGQTIAVRWLKTRLRLPLPAGTRG